MCPFLSQKIANLLIKFISRIRFLEKYNSLTTLEGCAHLLLGREPQPVPNKINRVLFLGGGESFACEKTFFVNKPLRAITADPVKNRLLEMLFSCFFIFLTSLLMGVQRSLVFPTEKVNKQMPRTWIGVY